MKVLNATDLFTWFATDRGVVRAVDGVSLSLEAGETLGIVGESGSGKSALLRSIMGLEDPARLARYDGRVVLGDRDLRSLSSRKLAAIWGRRIAIVLQNPLTSLNPVVRVGRQITESLEKHLRMSHAEAHRRAVELFREVGIPEPERRLKQYPHQLSGGMRQRVTIAIALSCEPEVLLADEPTTALDVTVQAQILVLLRRLQHQHGMAMVFVTHDLAVAAGLTDNIAVMYAGRVVEMGRTTDVIDDPAMPYTEALLASSPRLEYPPQMELPVIPGRPPSLVNEIVGCPFAPRCRYVQSRCETERPPLLEVLGRQRVAACWYPVDAAGVPVAETARTPR